MPQRLDALQQWLSGPLGLTNFRLLPASGDASFRRYFRIFMADGQTLIAMDAPPEREDCTPFVDIAARLEARGIHVPRILAAHPEEGFLLLSDLGETLYLDVLTDQTADRLYGDALGTLAAMQACVATADLPVYHRELLHGEMMLFPDWLITQALEINLSPGQQQMLEDTFEGLILNALQQPQVFVHRDYHSRNLMLRPQGNPGVLDFQDALVGPLTYDLVSLLKDCYISWPRERVEVWARGYYQSAVDCGIIRDQYQTEFMRWFDLMGVQRHLKAAGIFARLHLRDGKPGYLQDIPRTLTYITQAAPDYPELSGLGSLIRETLLPAAHQLAARHSQAHTQEPQT